MSGLRIEVDHDRCVGTQMCVQFAARTFALDAGGQSVVADAGGDDRETVLDGASQCPMEAITVTDAATGEQLFP